MTDLQTQIRAYAEQVDAAAPPVAELAVRGRSTRRPGSRAVPAFVAVGAATLVAVLSVGGVLLVGRGSPEVAAPSARPTTAAVVPAAADFRLLDPDPVFTSGPTGNTFGYPHAGPGGIVFVDGEFHAMRSGGDEEGSVVLYSTSPDGVQWQTVPEPLIVPDDVAWSATTVTVSSLVRVPDGTWMAFFFTTHDIGGHGEHFYEQRIGRATAATPAGPWVLDPDPVLAPGGKGSWDDYTLKYPAVVVDDGFVMFYAGGRSEGPGAIGRATSADGATWVKDPGPVLTGLAAPSWEDGGLNRPGVVRRGDSWVLTFSRRTGGVRGVAFSDDGRSWERHPDNPILDTADLPRGALFMTSLVERDGDLVWFVQAGGSRTDSETYVMVHDGPLP